MAQKPIPFPGGPGGPTGVTPPIGAVRAECIAFGDTLKLTFGDTGYFSHDNDNVFAPDLPTGLMMAETVIISPPAKPQQQTITLSLMDCRTGLLYTVVVQVLESCG
jgi:hypothetical protein